MTEIEREILTWEFEAVKIMMKLRNSGEKFSADNFYSEARAISMPAHLIKKFSGACFKRYKASGYIEKLKEFRLSNRNGSTPLPLYIGRKEPQKTELLELQKLSAGSENQPPVGESNPAILR
jgi:hypothetical protein